MQKRITIDYEVNDNPVAVMLGYEIYTDGNMQTITCTINPGGLRVPEWLHLRKFELRSWLTDGIYMPLYTDNEQLYNIEAVLFIDKAYREIMERENYKMAQV